jgi:predicted metalloprotease
MVQWRGRRRSGNVEDRRGQRYRQAAGFGILYFVFRLLGFGGVAVAALVLAAFWLFGGDWREDLFGQETLAQGEIPAGQEDAAEFAAVILADTEDVWRDAFAAQGITYPEPTMVLYSDAVESACGFAQSAVGPFYCPVDRRVYLDLTFFDELSGRMGAAGDFAPAYVIAHEVGHHVQAVLGALEQAERDKMGLTGAQQNAVQVRIELMADCFAGVWAGRADRTKGILDPGDIQEALAAAAAVGDDTMQRRARGRVTPDSFTHGSAEQRMRWFTTGYESGQMRDCDTFAAGAP